MDLLLVLLVLALYIVPSIVAFARRSSVTLFVVLFNLALGWTFVGWIIALVAAIASQPRPLAKKSTPQPAEQAPEVSRMVAARGGQVAPAAGAATRRGEAELAAYTRAFLREAMLHGSITQYQFDVLQHELDARLQPAVPAPLQPPAMAPPEAAPVIAPPRPVLPPPLEPARLVIPRKAPALEERAGVERPGAGPPAPTIAGWRVQFARASQRLTAELALDWLVYFGVLLTFAGTLGFSLFAFRGVNVNLRPLAEVLAPGFFFLLSWYSRRRNLVLAAASLELLAGAIALVAVLTSLSDGAGFPPDLTGMALPAGWSAAALALMGIYALIVRGRERSALRFLIGPLFWAAAWATGMWLNAGQYSVWQYPLASAGVVLALVWARRFPQHPVARATLTSAFVGLPLSFALCFLLAFTEHWPAWPLALTALLVLAGSELLAGGFVTTLALALAQASVVILALPALAPDWGAARTSVLAVFTSIALIEWQRRRHEHVSINYVLLTVMAAGLLAAWRQSEALALAWGVASVWLHVRTYWRPRFVAGGKVWQPLLSGVLPLGFAMGLWLTLEHGLAWLTLAALLTIASPFLRWRTAPNSRRAYFYSWYIPVAAGVVLAVATITSSPPLSLGAKVELPLIPVLTAATFGLSGRLSRPRIWALAIATGWAIQLTWQSLPVPSDSRPMAWSIMWAAAALAGSAVAWVWRHRPLAAHVLAASCLGAAVGVFSAPEGTARPTVLGLWSLVWLVGLVSHEQKRASFSWLIRQPAMLKRALGYAPAAIFLGSVPFFLAQLGETLGVFVQPGRVGVALGLASVGYSLVANRVRDHQTLASMTAVGGVIVSVAGVAVAAPAVIPSILSVALAIASIAAMARSLRRPFMAWLAWALSVALALLVAYQAGVPIDNLYRVAIGLATAYLVGGLAYDDLRAGRRAPGEGLRVGWVLQPVALGALILPAGLSFTFPQAPHVFGWWALGVAGVYLCTAWQLRAGVITVATWSLASLAATVLLPWAAWDQPELWLPLAAALVLAAFGLSFRKTGVLWWQRWDIAPLFVAHGLSALALLRSTAVGSLPLTWAGTGLLMLSIAAWKRHWSWSVAGGMLILIASNRAAPGWFALSLLCAALALLITSIRTGGVLRLTSRWASSAFAGWAWWEMLLWSGWSQEWQVRATLLTLMLGALILGGLTWTGRPSLAWLSSWAALDFVGLGAVAAGVLGQASPWLLALTLVAFALALLALSIRSRGWVRWMAEWASTAGMGWAWLEVMNWTAWSPRQRLDATLLALAGTALILAALVWLRRPSIAWLGSWGGLELIGLGGSVAYMYGQPVSWTVAPSLMAYAAALLAVSIRSGGELRWTAESASTAAVAGAWWEAMLWTGWGQTQRLDATLIALAIVAMLLGVLVRLGRPKLPWLGTWAALELTGLGACLLVASSRPVPWTATGALAVYAVVSAVSAPVLPFRGPRELSAAFLFLAGESAASTLALTARPHLGLAMGGGLVGWVLLVLCRRDARLRPWWLAVSGYAALQSLLAVALSVLMWPDRTGLIAALGIFGVEAAAVGVMLRRMGIVSAAPALLCGSWLLFETEAIHGNVQWTTIPIGIAVLAISEMGRIARKPGAAVTMPRSILVLLDFSGMGLVCGAALVEAVTVDVLYAFVAVACGLAIAGWALLTRVRRRMEMGVSVASLGLILAVAVPLAELVPYIQRAAFWATLAGMGLLFLLAAIALEQNRVRIGATLHRIGDLMRSWE